jgi:NAD-dependent dihydropyrimidine dehydrogenase PreA subunit
MKTATIGLFRLHGWKGFLLFIDGYVYLKYIKLYVGTVSRAFGLVSKIIGKRNKVLFLPVIRFLTSRYHGKVMLLNDAKKIVRLNRDVAVPKSLAETVIPFDMANQLIFRNPDAIAAIECACRNARKHDCQPANKCIIIGEPYVSFVMQQKAANPIKLTKDEALELLKTCKEKGYVQNAYFKDGVGNQMYAICNCCPECCVSIGAHKMFARLGILEDSLAQSGYVAYVNESQCKGHGACAKKCPFGAISVKDGRSCVEEKLCMGCGTCAESCPEGAIVMRRDRDKGIPLDIHELVPASIS